MVTERDESINNKTVERLAAMIMKARHQNSNQHKKPKDFGI